MTAIQQRRAGSPTTSPCCTNGDNNNNNIHNESNIMAPQRLYYTTTTNTSTKNLLVDNHHNYNHHNGSSTSSYASSSPSSNKVHGRSCRDSLRLYLFLKPQYSLVRFVLFVVVGICSLSLAFRLHATAVSQTLGGGGGGKNHQYSTSSSNRVLFQQPPAQDILLQSLMNKQMKHYQQHNMPKSYSSSSSSSSSYSSSSSSNSAADELFHDAGYSVKPRVVGVYWASDYDDKMMKEKEEEEGEEEGYVRHQKNKKEDEEENTNNNNNIITLGYEQLDPNMIRPYSDRKIYVSKTSMKKQLKLLDSGSYDHQLRDDFEPGDCEAQYSWQKTSFPTCNALHEQALNEMRLGHHSRVKFLANGYWRDVWMVRDNDWEPLALKTIRYMHEYVDRNYDRHRRDAVAMERMTSSPNVVGIYSFCGNSGIFEYASGGSLEDAIWYSDEPEWNSTEKLIVAYQAASGLADLHNVDVEGRASIAHTDITPSQFVFVNSVGRFLLNDFNRCRFISWDKKKDKACNFHVGSNPGTFRSPEEYRYDLESEKVDVYSLGNIFYALMEKTYPYEKKLSKKKAQEKIMAGERPPLSDKYAKSTDQFTQALIKAMNMAWIHKPEERASAREVEQYLDAELTRLGVNGQPA